MLLLLVTMVAATPTGPLTPKERVVYQGAKCDAYRSALQAAVNKAAASEPSDTSPTSIMQRVVNEIERPPSDGDAVTWQLCRGYAVRDLDDLRTRTLQVEATTMLNRFAVAMKGNFVEFGKLCASTTPVPADVSMLATGPYTAQPGDWDDTWKCVSGDQFEGKPQYFQYAITTDAKGKAFTITAKGFPSRDGKLRTFTISGKVAGGQVTTGDIVKK
jgi:hypothetical protein